MLSPLPQLTTCSKTSLSCRNVFFCSILYSVCCLDQCVLATYFCRRRLPQNPCSSCPDSRSCHVWGLFDCLDCPLESVGVNSKARSIIGTQSCYSLCHKAHCCSPDSGIQAPTDNYMPISLSIKFLRLRLCQTQQKTASSIIAYALYIVLKPYWR